MGRSSLTRAGKASQGQLQQEGGGRTTWSARTSVSLSLSLCLSVSTLNRCDLQGTTHAICTEHVYVAAAPFKKAQQKVLL